MAAETVDALELQIRSRAENASRDIASLASSVSDFATKVQSHIGVLRELADALKTIASSASAAGRTRGLGKLVDQVTGKSAATSIKAAVSSANKSAAVKQLTKPTPSGYPKWLPTTAPNVVGKYAYQFDPATKQFADIRKNAETAAPAIERVTEAMKEAKAVGDTSWTKNITAPNVVGKYTKQFNPESGQWEKIGEAAANAGSLNSNLAEAAKSAKELSGASKKVDDFIKDADKSSVTLKSAFSAIGKEIKHSLIGQIGRVAKMRGLRYLVKAFASGIKEGISNLYQWSNAVGGPFASAMDTIASKSMLAKNSLATAFAPAIQALIPLISTVVSWINTACNAIAQFFALLGGQTSWVKATESAEQWGKAVKSGAGGAKAAHEEMKDLLADWDELNIIQSETGSGGGGGGGGGGAAANYADMFEQMDVFDKWTQYFDEIKQIVAAIGAGIAGWYLVERASDFLKMMGFAEGKIDKIKGILLKGLVGGVLLTISFALASASGKSIAMDGITIGNVVSSIGALLTGALGGYFVGSAIAEGLMAAAGIAFPHAGLVGAVAGLTLAAIVEVKAYLDTKDQMAYDIAKQWVYANAFDYDIEARLNLVNATLSNVRAARAGLKESVAGLLGTIDALKLGINDSETLKQLKEQLGNSESGVIHDLNVYASEAKNVVKLFYTMNPKMEGEGGIDSAASYLKASDGWDLLTGKLASLGNELGQYIVDGETTQIKAGYEDVVASILDQIAKITSAVTSGKVTSEVMLDLNVAIATDAAQKIPEVLKDVETKARKAAESLYDEMLLAQQDLVSSLEAGGLTNTQEYKDAVAGLNRLTAPGARTSYVDSYVESIMGNASEKVTKYYADQFAKGPLEEFFKIMFDKRWTDEELEDFGPDYTIDDFINSQLEAQLSEIPKDIYGWLADHGFNWEDYMTDDQRRNLQDARDRTGNKPIEEEAFEAFAEETNAAAEAALDSSETVGDLSEKSSEAATAVKDLAEETTAATTAMTKQEEAAQAWWDEFRASGGEETNGTLTKADELQLAYENNAEQVNALYDRIDKLIETNPDWKNLENLPSDWFTSGITIDAATSGMATDAAVNGVNETIGSNMSTANTLLSALVAWGREMSTGMNSIGNRPINVVISPSGSWGDMNTRSGRMYDRITGMNS